jgi:hypothetical protein
MDKWQGSNYFFFKAKLLVGPAGIKPVLLTGFAVLMPFVLFVSYGSDVNTNLTT